MKHARNLVVIRGAKRNGGGFKGEIMKTKRQLAICALIIVLLVVFGAGVLSHSLWWTYRTKRIQESIHPAVRIHVWHNQPSGVTVYSRPVRVSNDRRLAELCIQRGEEVKTIPRKRDESWHNFFVVSGTNIAFVLVSIENNHNYYSTRLVKLVLPRSNQELDMVSVETILTMDSLNVEQGDSRINGIEGATHNGHRLLLSRAVPCDIKQKPKSWKLEDIIYDVDRQEFEQPSFETDRPMLGGNWVVPRL